MLLADGRRHDGHSSARVCKQTCENMSTPPARRITIGGVPSKIVSIPRRISLSASGTSAVAIDNKIEQAMDLVKSHLMFAVREEVEVLKERISELMDRINQLEYENNILKANASQETLAQLTTGGNSVAAVAAAAQQQQQQQVSTAAAAAAAAAAALITGGTTKVPPSPANPANGSVS